jgi:hypothetical protein
MKIGILLFKVRKKATLNPYLDIGVSGWNE